MEHLKTMPPAMDLDCFQPDGGRVSIALDAVYQTEAVLSALAMSARQMDINSLPLLVLSLCKRLDELNGVVMSALSDGLEDTGRLRSVLGVASPKARETVVIQ